MEMVREGWTGREPGARVWTFSSSLMYSMAVSTTIGIMVIFIKCEQMSSGYGNLVPKTPMGKIVTMIYALMGIPIMFIYVATIGSILAQGFKFIYTKLCR